MTTVCTVSSTLPVLMPVCSFASIIIIHDPLHATRQKDSAGQARIHPFIWGSIPHARRQVSHLLSFTSSALGLLSTASRTSVSVLSRVGVCCACIRNKAPTTPTWSDTRTAHETTLFLCLSIRPSIVHSSTRPLAHSSIRSSIHPSTHSPRETATNRGREERRGEKRRE
ncbi:hypothetical protein F4803DRAFT_117744 [Xylaria telfairii]|nr:hypothetical protein F4803DRAFT_117744 [Xylaria telfairii]